VLAVQHDRERSAHESDHEPGGHPEVRQVGADLRHHRADAPDVARCAGHLPGGRDDGRAAAAPGVGALWLPPDRLPDHDGL
jgi:hypothetical protein